MFGLVGVCLLKSKHKQCMVYRGVKAPVLESTAELNNFDTSGMLVYTKEICDQELIFAVTKSFLNTIATMFIGHFAHKVGTII